MLLSFGFPLFQLLWVLMWSTVLGLVLQLLAARLGCVTGNKTVIDLVATLFRINFFCCRNPFLIITDPILYLCISLFTPPSNPLKLYI